MSNNESFISTTWKFLVYKTYHINIKLTIQIRFQKNLPDSVCPMFVGMFYCLELRSSNTPIHSLWRRKLQFICDVYSVLKIQIWTELYFYFLNSNPKVTNFKRFSYDYSVTCVSWVLMFLLTWCLQKQNIFYKLPSNNVRFT